MPETNPAKSRTGVNAARALSILLAVAVAALPFSAHAEDQAAPAPPGRATELAPCEEPGPEGQAQACPGKGQDSQGRELTRAPGVPYRGTLIDGERMDVILAKRKAAESERDYLRLQLQDEQARHALTTQERDEARQTRGPGWSVLIGASATALVVGLIVGVAGTLTIQDRAGR